MSTAFQEDNPVTDWINKVRAGNDDAADRLWQHYFDHLQAAMQRRISPQTQAVYDEEDAALSAFQSLCNGLVQGRYPDIRDRTSLWRLLLVIASRKVMNRHRYDGQEKRDRDQEVSLDLLFGDSHFGEINLPGPEPTPEMLMELEEASAELFGRLDDQTLTEVAQLKLEGFTNLEIAGRMGLTDRTVRRKVELIRRIWEQ